MDLQLKEVAQLLHMSEETLHTWAQEGKIPAYRLKDHYCFNRLEIEEWLMSQELDQPQKAEGKSNLQFSLYRALYRGDVLCDVEGESKEQVIRAAMEQMASRFDLDPEVLTDLFLDRERLMSTGLGHGVGIPHTRDFLLDTHFDVVLVVYPKHPLEYGALDHEPVHTLFFLFACSDRNHLNLLAKVAHLSLAEKARAFYRTKPSKGQLLDFVKQWESSLAS